MEQGKRVESAFAHQAYLSVEAYLRISPLLAVRDYSRVPSRTGLGGQNRFKVLQSYPLRNNQKRAQYKAH
jgi:hypothetical protein